MQPGGGASPESTRERKNDGREQESFLKSAAYCADIYVVNTARASDGMVGISAQKSERPELSSEPLVIYSVNGLATTTAAASATATTRSAAITAASATAARALRRAGFTSLQHS